MDILKNVPLGLYLEAPRTWLHNLDPRVKIVWLLSILLSPILSDNLWRILVVAGLTGLTLFTLPLRIWIRQLSWVVGLGLLMLGLTALAPDALGVTSVPQRQTSLTPAYGLVAVPPLSNPTDPLNQSLTQLSQSQPYRYELLNTRLLGVLPVRISRRSLSVAIRVGTLVFTLLYTTNLFLLTTPPEAVTEALTRLLRPLERWRIPVGEMMFTTTLALRFLPLVLEEVQNLIRSVRTRDIHWQSLGLRGALHLVVALVDRLLENLLLRAAQSSAAMQVRGYQGADHAVRWYDLHLRGIDYTVLGLLPLFWILRLLQFNAF